MQRIIAAPVKRFKDRALVFIADAGPVSRTSNVATCPE
jgi:hypothetical protein